MTFFYGGYFSLPSGQTGFLTCHSILSEVSVDNIAPSADESKKTRFDFYLLYE
jgi:hypothetical protein